MMITRTKLSAIARASSIARKGNNLQIRYTTPSVLNNIYYSTSASRTYVAVKNNEGDSQTIKKLQSNDGNKEKEMLAESTEIAIRAYLNQKYPNTFSPLTCITQNGKDGNNSKSVNDNTAHNTKTLSISKPTASKTTRDTEIASLLNKINTLATLNGYHKVPSSQMIPNKQVNLAEGIKAVAHKNASFLQEEYIFYSRPSHAKRKENFQFITTNTPKSCHNDHPPFIEEDFKPFKILETKVEKRLTSWEEDIKLKREKVVKRGVDYVEHIQDGVKKVTNTVVRAVKRKDEGKEGQQQRNGNQADDVATKLSTENRSDGIDPKKEEEDAEEDVIVISRQTGDLFLIENISPSFRLLILPIPSTTTKTHTKTSPPPYKLSHARSGRIITTSLVLFGALPLMYRSLVFTMDHPWLARVVAASVAGSVGYSLWSFSYGARTRQSGVISAALASRMVARDDALVSALKEEIVRVLTAEVMDIYYCITLKEHDQQQHLLNQREGKTAEVDAYEVASVLGLIQWQPSVTVTENTGMETEHHDEIKIRGGDIGSWSALDFSEAKNELSRKTVEFMKGEMGENAPR